MRMFIKRRQHQPENDLKTLKRAAGAPFAFCHRMINDLRTVLKVSATFGEDLGDKHQKYVAD